MTALTVLALFVGGCAGVGPSAVTNGRPAYNAVINETEDQQILSMIVRQRYDETFGMLVVSSVTASLRVGATGGANAGIGPRSGFEGNLVPLSVGVMYEENPTISYAPLRGEIFLERMLAPISAEQAVLLTRMSTDEVEVLRMLVRRANGIVNPLYASRRTAGDDGGVFGRFIELYVGLRERGRLDIVLTDDGSYRVLLHGYTEDEAEKVEELLRVLGVGGGRAGPGPIAVPLRFFVGTPRADGIDLETPSALEVIGAASRGVDVPDEHLSAGFVRSDAGAASGELLRIHSSRELPDGVLVAVRHRGWWFYVDGRDARSKQAFKILRTLIGLRLDEGAAGQAAPVLTIPAAR